MDVANCKILYLAELLFMLAADIISNTRWQHLHQEAPVFM